MLLHVYIAETLHIEYVLVSVQFIGDPREFLSKLLRQECSDSAP